MVSPLSPGVAAGTTSSPNTQHKLLQTQLSKNLVPCVFPSLPSFPLSLSN